MNKALNYIESFISEHHVMSLATAIKDEISACSLFYAYDSESIAFIVASSDDTRHIKHIKVNKKVAGNILLETQEVGEIKGLQFRGKFELLDNSELESLYLNAYPYSKEMNPKLWKISVDSFKLTDNTLGFGEKITWLRV